MKYFYIGLLILCLLLCACYLSTRQIRVRTEAMALPLRRAMQAFHAGNIPAKTRFLEEADAHWHRSEPCFAALLSHDKTVQVSEDLRALFVVKDEDFDQICTRLIDQLYRIQRMDLPIWENIF